MEITGYFKSKGGKQYVAFKEKKTGTEFITDGFHDKKKTGDYMRAYYQEVKQEEIDLQKITSRMRGARPWHPLLKELRKANEQCVEVSGC